MTSPWQKYDEQLYEDETVARMQESMTLFSSISNSQWFSKSSMVLFLNKVLAKPFSSVTESDV